jgi:hypothetical protein
MHHHPDHAHPAILDALTFTVEALSARGDDAKLQGLAQRLSPLLSDHDTIEADGHALRRAVIAATARVKVADAALDAGIAAFAKDLLALSGGAADPLYQGYFVDGHEDVIALGLDSELPQVAVIVGRLDADAAAPAGLRAHLEPLRAGMRMGNAALADRSDAYTDLGRHEARCVAWRETAGCALRSTRRALVALATDRGLASTWIDTFFA